MGVRERERERRKEREREKERQRERERERAIERDREREDYRDYGSDIFIFILRNTDADCIRCPQKYGSRSAVLENTDLMVGPSPP